MKLTATLSLAVTLLVAVLTFGNARAANTSDAAAQPAAEAIHTKLTYVTEATEPSIVPTTTTRTTTTTRPTTTTKQMTTTTKSATTTEPLPSMTVLHSKLTMAETTTMTQQ